MEIKSIPQVIYRYGNNNFSIKGYSESDWIFSLIKKTKTFYEIDLLKYINFTLSKRQGFIVDVGANIGNHAVYFGVIMQKKVVCFEPNPPVFKILKENLKINKVDCQIYDIGLGAINSRYSLDDNHFAAKNNIGAVKLIECDKGMIKVKTLDSVYNNFDASRDENIIGIKADIEGMESEMLKGAVETIKVYKPDLFLEINDKDNMNKIESILYPLGYQKLYSYAETPVWHFSHKSQLSFIQKQKLYIYYHVARLKRLIRNSITS
jgi:FkbM family methyltransferase